MSFRLAILDISISNVSIVYLIVIGVPWTNYGGSCCVSHCGLCKASRKYTANTSPSHATGEGLRHPFCHICDLVDDYAMFIAFPSWWSHVLYWWGCANLKEMIICDSPRIFLTCHSSADSYLNTTDIYVVLMETHSGNDIECVFYKYGAIIWEILQRLLSAHTRPMVGGLAFHDLKLLKNSYQDKLSRPQ